MSTAVLIVEDEEVLARNMATYLGRHGFEVEIAGSAEEALARMAEFRPDAIVLDVHLPGMDGMAMLARLRELDASPAVIMVTGHGDVEMAVEAMKAGVLDFLTKPVPLAKLRLLLERAAGATQRDSELAYHRRREADGAALEALRGVSPGMLRLKDRLRQLLQAEAHLQDGPPPAVLVRGETGTGKELVARALHFSGARRDRPFVELNCAALPAQLLESELFGHERGAFTDARERKLGLVETAEGGTLFLDEIGDMELPLQAKLLKLLEEHRVRRLGSLREQQVDVRIVAATHQPLDRLVREGRFRADLYFRLRVVELDLPPLRDRGDDVLQLADGFLAAHAARYGRPCPTLTPRARDALQRHAWPGNVRELRNLLEQAVLLARGATLDLEDLALRDEAMAVPVARLTADATTTLPDMERLALTEALARTGGNVSRAARELGISRDTLRYRIDKHGLGERP
ncbi:sigma-54-dependent transcriptional regulator [Rubrivivax albus]|uniref:Sigma-54-dependent Fis family transcriptional regulator n=1 Tax=Rubrivivax albus TaxID=2499835 RepID=A0A437JZM2_9BURK|nr:sigma-54 dependent transcriptional regulator [Rubrivivax albus]RVT53520.1 sigma-54-dependent Fis family transcriptional regulator [Rubrivivax albus]